MSSGCGIFVSFSAFEKLSTIFRVWAKNRTFMAEKKKSVNSVHLNSAITFGAANRWVWPEMTSQQTLRAGLHVTT